jgi:hypothetical protein
MEERVVVDAVASKIDATCIFFTHKSSYTKRGEPYLNAVDVAQTISSGGNTSRRIIGRHQHGVGGKLIACAVVLRGCADVDSECSSLTHFVKWSGREEAVRAVPHVAAHALLRLVSHSKRAAP